MIKCFFIPNFLIDKIPLEVYKDKIAILDRLNLIDHRGIPIFRIIYDYKAYDSTNASTFILYNLAPEDYTHLSLLGLVLNPNNGAINPHIANAIVRKRKTIKRHLCYTQL